MTYLYLIFILICVLPAFGEIVVINSADGGPGSLRQALADSTESETITFAPELSGATILLESSYGALQQSVVIDGSSLPQKLTIDGQDAVGFIFAGPSRTLGVKSLKFTRLSQEDGFKVPLASRKELTIEDCDFTHCINGNVIQSYQILTIRGSTFTDNNGGVSNSQFTNRPRGQFTISNSIFSKNTGRAVYNGSLSDCKIDGCTISQNTNTNEGSGIFNLGSLTASNTTIAGNKALQRGGGIFNFSDAILINCTISENSARWSGGGIYSDRPFSNLMLRNCIVSNNRAQRDHDIEGSSFGSRNLISEPALLAPIGNYGGPTETMPPLPGSRALDQGSRASVFDRVILSDQRGLSRNENGRPDIGAVEIQSFEPALPSLIENPVVTRTNDRNRALSEIIPDDLSLREAVAIATPGSTITFREELSGGTLPIALGEIRITRDLVLDGSALATPPTLDAGKLSRHFFVNPGVQASLIGLQIIHGKNEEVESGGAILNLGSLEIDRCLFKENKSEGNGGAIHSHGQLIADQATFDNCSSDRDGGAISTSDSGAISLTGCTLSGNSSRDNGGAIALSGNKPSTLTQCTLACNRARDDGGAIFGAGELSTLTLVQCTVSANSAQREGGGIANADGLSLESSVVAHNWAMEFPDLDEDTAALIGVNFIKGDPLLALLGDYGGPVKSMPPFPGSPLIDPVGGASSSSLARDQRGGNRLVNGTLDIGATESGGLAGEDPQFIEDPIVTSAVDRLSSGTQPSLDDLSLREAIAFAKPGATIRFSEALSSREIQLEKGQVIFGRKVAIDAGHLEDPLILKIPDFQTSFTLLPSAEITFKNITLTTVPELRSGDFPITNLGSLDLQECHFTKIISWGHCIFNRGKLTVSDSTFSGNSSGAIRNNLEGSFTITKSTFSGDRGFFGSVISSNGENRDFVPPAGGVPLCRISQCTFSNNARLSMSLGAISRTIIDHCTITAENNPEILGGIIITHYPDSDEFSANVVMTNTILSAANYSFFENRRIPPEELIPQLATGSGNNYLGNLPLLAPLGDWGGLTKTRPPLPGSPVIDRGRNDDTSTDQRKLPRNVGAAPDIGAVEYQGDPEIFFIPTFHVDSDGDGLTNGLEFAIGSSPYRAEHRSEKFFQQLSTGHFRFGLDPEMTDKIILSLTRSSDLIRFDSVVASNEDFPFTIEENSIATVLDDSPPAEDRAFYRLEAELRTRDE